MYLFNLGAGRRLRFVALAVAMTAPAWEQGVAWGANASLIDEDINVDGLGFGRSDPFVFGEVYSMDATASFNGNEILVQTQNGQSGNTGAGMSVPISNGENGINQSQDGGDNEVDNPDPPNTTPANTVFGTIGNASGKLENGNVVRYSMWVRKDPASPANVDPQIQPVLKFEFWKQALGLDTDNAGGAQPGFGDKIIDTDQHLNSGIWIDLDGDGIVVNGNAAEEGRVRSVTDTDWTLIEVTHVVNDLQWPGIGDDVYTVEDVEEIRGVLFWGDFAGTDLNNAGSLWFDNLLMEVFKNTAAVTPVANSNPEPGPAGDFNNDFDVDTPDYNLWKTAFGATTGGDADFDLDSDGLDFLRWQRNFGRVPPNAGAAAGSVPEPASASLAVAALGLVAARRRSRQV